MEKHTCPHCGQQGISALRKQLLGPVLSTNCSECGGTVSVPFGKTFLSLSPFYVSLFVLLFVAENGLLSFWVGAFGAMITGVLWSSIVPLVKR